MDNGVHKLMDIEAWAMHREIGREISYWWSVFHLVRHYQKSTGWRDMQMNSNRGSFTTDAKATKTKKLIVEEDRCIDLQNMKVAIRVLRQMEPSVKQIIWRRIIECIWLVGAVQNCSDIISLILIEFEMLTWPIHRYDKNWRPVWKDRSGVVVGVGASIQCVGTS